MRFSGRSLDEIPPFKKSFEEVQKSALAFNKAVHLL
jgi:hypothetical protein